MGISYTERVQGVCQALEQRLKNRLYRPGDRFLTARQLADQYEVSYQTAHRLLADFAQRGLIVRRPRSGTFIAGTHPKPTHVVLMLHERSDNPHGFGGKLKQSLVQSLCEAGIDCRLAEDTHQPLDPKAMPVIWECPHAVDQCVAQQRPGVLVNERPEPGWGSSLLDSIGTDDYAGGALAADTLMQGNSKPYRFGILTGPEHDRRSDERVAGFLSRVDTTDVAHAANWHRDAGRRASQQMLKKDLSGLFAANDRLAQGALLGYRDANKQPPLIVGYDDAPIAQQLGLTTIALPWQEIAKAVVQRAELRLKGEMSAACTILLQPSVVFR